MLLLLFRHAPRWTSGSRTSFCSLGVHVKANATRRHASHEASRTTNSCKPLRILFCGSDAFSCASLKALHREQQADPAGIRSIDVLCRPGKRAGRSLKTIREVQIKGFARSLGLTVHERDTFTGWELPKPDGEPINLIIAVSFGLFVPSRILKSAEYGGLNVHPSLLPNFRGASPLQHTIMHGVEYTGVTLQTLDHKSFDHGTILAQSTAPGMKLDLQRKPYFVDLLNLVMPLGADILVKGIRERLFVPPLPELTLSPPIGDLIDAPKIQPKDKEIDWMNWDATTIGRRYRALGPLWNSIVLSSGKKVRIKWDGIEEVEMPETFKYLLENPLKSFRVDENKESSPPIDFLVSETSVGENVSLPFIKDEEAIMIGVKDKAVRISHITIEGMGKKVAGLAADTLRKPHQ